MQIKGWPLSRKIRVSVLKDGFVSKAVQHFLQLARRKMPEGHFVALETLPSSAVR